MILSVSTTLMKAIDASCSTASRTASEHAASDASEPSMGTRMVWDSPMSELLVRLMNGCSARAKLGLMGERLRAFTHHRPGLACVHHEDAHARIVHGDVR